MSSVRGQPKPVQKTRRRSVCLQSPPLHPALSMSAILRDIRYGIRSLAKSPGLTIVATIALTFGIGLTAVMFSIIYGALMKGLPFEEGDRIVQIVRHNPVTGGRRTWARRSRISSIIATSRSRWRSLAAYYAGTVNVSGEVEAERFAGAFVTASVFELTRVRPLLGRYFQAGEDTPSGPRVAVLGYGMWQRRFGGDSAIVGKALRANGVPYTIIGVMPEGFRFPDDAALWLPLQLDPLATQARPGELAHRRRSPEGRRHDGSGDGRRERDRAATGEGIQGDQREHRRLGEGLRRRRDRARSRGSCCTRCWEPCSSCC